MRKKTIVFVVIGGLILSSVAIYIQRFLSPDNEVQEQGQFEDEYVNETSQPMEEEEQERVEEYVQSDSQGAVDIAVILQNLIEENEDDLVFKVMLNTHSVDLEALDYTKLAKLTTDQGIEITDGFTWELEGGGGHHLSGYLKIPREYKEEKIVIDSTQNMNLIITGLDGQESSEFIWTKEHLEAIK